MSHHQFFVQKEHQLMWCKVPKAASTSWLHAFLQLANVPQHQMPEVRCSPDSMQYVVYTPSEQGMLNPPLNVVLKGNDRIGFTVDSAVKSVFHMSAAPVVD